MHPARGQRLRADRVRGPLLCHGLADFIQQRLPFRLGGNPLAKDGFEFRLAEILAIGAHLAQGRQPVLDLRLAARGQHGLQQHQAPAQLGRPRDLAIERFDLLRDDAMTRRPLARQQRADRGKRQA